VALNLYLTAILSPFATVSEHRGNRSQLLSIINVIDIEEETWSPMYGLKGKIDATVLATVKAPTSEGKFLVPFELKTSKTDKNITHRAQTTLYTLLLSDRYNVDISCGVLYYSSPTVMIKIPALRDEMRSLMQERNQLAGYLKSPRELPPLIGEQFKCKNCARAGECMIYHSAQGGTQDSSGVPEIFESFTSHVTQRHLDFFTHWDELLAKESSDADRYIKEIWTMTSSSRESVG
jgi:DNA replication ATP-dependent helicase Dna2